MQRAITKRCLQKLIEEKVAVKQQILDEKEAQAIKDKKKSKTKKASKVDEKT